MAGGRRQREASDERRATSRVEEPAAGPAAAISDCSCHLIVALFVVVDVDVVAVAVIVIVIVI